MTDPLAISRYELQARTDGKGLSTFQMCFIAIAAIIMLVLGNIVYTAFTTDSNKDNGKQEVMIDVLTENNRIMAESIKRKEAADKVTLEITTKTQEEKNLQVAVHADNHIKTEEKVTNIKKQFENNFKNVQDPQTTAAMVKQLEADVSTVRVTALWVNFCKYDNSSECKAFKK